MSEVAENPELNAQYNELLSELKKTQKELADQKGLLDGLIHPQTPIEQSEPIETPVKLNLFQRIRLKLNSEI